MLNLVCTDSGSALAGARSVFAEVRSVMTELADFTPLMTGGIMIYAV
jgi:hypothetical protein